MQIVLKIFKPNFFRIFEVKLFPVAKFCQLLIFEMLSIQQVHFLHKSYIIYNIACRFCAHKIMNVTRFEFAEYITILTFLKQPK
jgi:hypothetical protein